jgi:hypothetical protein
MSSLQCAGIFAICVFFANRASAEDSKDNAAERASAPTLHAAGSVSKPLQARRATHADGKALVAGAVLLGFGYALALSVPLTRNFRGDSDRLAVPVAGPWLSKVTWPYALDGLLQLGGVAFMVDAYANPVAVLAPSEAVLGLKHYPDCSLNMRLRF